MFENNIEPKNEFSAQTNVENEKMKWTPIPMTYFDLMMLKDKEGLVCLGCGGNLDEWYEGINKMMVEEGVTTNPYIFKEVAVVTLPNIVIMVFFFPEDILDFNVGRLAIVRLNFDWMKWLSDYIYIGREANGITDEALQKLQKRISGFPEEDQRKVNSYINVALSYGYLSIEEIANFGDSAFTVLVDEAKLLVDSVQSTIDAYYDRIQEEGENFSKTQKEKANIDE